MLTSFYIPSGVIHGRVVALFLGLCLASGALADDTKLRYKLPSEPMTYRYIMSSDSETSGEMFGEAGIKSGMQQAAICQFQTKSTTGESSVVEMVYTAMKLRQAMPMGKPLYVDTTSPEFKSAKLADLDPMARMISSMIGKGITVTVDPRGQVTKVEKTSMFADMAKEMPDGGGVARSMMDQMFGDEAIGKMFKDLFVPLPDGAVKPGEFWTTSSTQSVPMFGGMKRTTTWTYAGDDMIGGNILAKLTSSMAMEMVPADPDAKSGMPQIPGLDMKALVMDAKGSGVAFFDAKLGRLQSMSFKLVTPMSMTTTMPAVGKQPAHTMTMKSQTAMAVSMTLVPDGAPVDPDNLVKKPEPEAPTKHK